MSVKRKKIEKYLRIPKDFGVILAHLVTDITFGPIF